MEKEKTRSSWEKFKENRPALLLSSAVIIAFNLLCFGIDAYKKHKTEQERIRAPRERPEEYYPKECYRYKECLEIPKKETKWNAKTWMQSVDIRQLQGWWNWGLNWEL